MIKKMQDFLRAKRSEEDKKEGNKGFSLVELIIVIAIMAILVGIVGTQVIPYLNRSREAKDLQELDALNTAATTAYSYNAEAFGTGQVTITLGTSGTPTVSGDLDESNNVSDDFVQLSGYSNVKDISWSSNAGKALSTVTITIDPSAGTITTEADGFDDVVSNVGGATSSSRGDNNG